MTHQENAQQMTDGVHLYTQSWLPGGEPRAVVLLVHGLGEHSGRYQHVAGFFTHCDYAVASFDLRGHGRSGGIRGDGVSFDRIGQDIEEMESEVQRRFPGLPHFIYGHSLGGALALYYGFRCRPAAAGFIVSAPGLATAKPVPASTLIVGRILSRLIPTMQMNNGLDRSGLSRDPAIVDRYNADPLVHPKISARFGIDLIEKGKWMLAQSAFPHPLLLLQGSADRLIDAEANRRFGQRLQGDVTLKVFAGFYHELHNEREQAEVLETILQWMEAHL